MSEMRKYPKTNDQLIKEFFITNKDEWGMAEVVFTEWIEHHDVGSNYRVTFADGRVSDWNVHYDEDSIVSVDEYNVVIERG